jgi:phosphatidylglycerophosphatase C
VKKAIAFFDFDGTITTKDTFLEFIKFCKGSLSFYLGFLWNSPYIVAFKLKIISNQKAKEKVFGYFFRDINIADFEKLCLAFSKERLPALIRPKALEEISRLQKEGCVIVVVTASPENWIRPWTAQHQLEILGSLLEVWNGRITGKLEGKNCHGVEKVRRIMEKYVMADFTEVYAYGDSKADQHMFELATQNFYRPFRP